MLILPIRSAVNAEQQRYLRSFHITDRVSEQPMDFCSILALEADRLRLAQLQFSEQRIVLMRKLFKLQFLTNELCGIDLVVMIVVARDRDRALSRAVPLPQHDCLIGNRSCAATSDRYTHAVHVRIVSCGGEDCLAVIAPP